MLRQCHCVAAPDQIGPSNRNTDNNQRKRSTSCFNCYCFILKCLTGPPVAHYLASMSLSVHLNQCCLGSTALFCFVSWFPAVFLFFSVRLYFLIFSVPPTLETLQGRLWLFLYLPSPWVIKVSFCSLNLWCLWVSAYILKKITENVTRIYKKQSNWGVTAWTQVPL